MVAQSTAHAATESQAAKKYSSESASALRRLFKRREAIRSADPFTVAIVAVAESYLYVNGTLCHILDRTLRILNLHDSSRHETVIDIRALLETTITDFQEPKRYKFQILHYAEGIVSCLYTQSKPSPEGWLVVLNVDNHEVLTSLELETSYKIFVRNDRDFLYYGTHSEFGDDDFRRWVLRGYNIHEGTWFEDKVHLLDMVGSDIGSSIAFEIIDGNFYGLSNQTSFEVEEVDWTSYYHCFRFPVDRPRQKHTEKSVKKNMWRRQHAEGPIDDRWSFIRLQRNERDGELQILESRKEWLSGQSTGKRTYYTTNLDFPSKDDQHAIEQNRNEEGSSNNDANTTPPSPSHMYNRTPPPPTETPLRNPYYTHRGDDANTALMFTLSKCFIRSYHSSCQSFLDLVDDPCPSDSNTQRLRLRVGSRQLRSDEKLRSESEAVDATLSTDQQIKRLYKNEGENKIAFWPEETSPALDDLYAVLNPPAFLGNVKGTWDERSLVYSTGSNGVQAIVFVSFDSGIYLRGLRQWRKDGDFEGPVDGASHDIPEYNLEEDNLEDTGELPNQVKGKEAAVEPSPGCESPPTIGFPTPAPTDSASSSQLQCNPRVESVPSWAASEPAMYLDIACGFNFHWQPDGSVQNLQVS